MPDLTFAVDATALQLRTRRGPVYGPIDLALAPGDTAMLVGASGAGKTALLLTLAGRMRPSGGTLRVMGIDARRRPGAARALVSLGLFAGLNDLAEPLTVSDTVRAELALRGTTPTRERVAAVPAALDLPLDGKERVGDLTMGGRATLGVALALVAKPRVLVVDDMDADLDPEERATLRDVLRRVADTGITVIGSCIDPASARFADVVVPMASRTGSEVPAHAFAQSR